MIEYHPTKYSNPKNNGLWSAWNTVAPFLEDILDTFNVNRGKALELGVGNGYSYSILQNYFTTVIGVDIDIKDFKGDNYIILETSFESFIELSKDYYDLIHIDLSHTYKQTLYAGDWAIKNGEIILFHDTRMIPVYKAVDELAEKYNKEFYNLYDTCGLGILV